MDSKLRKRHRILERISFNTEIVINDSVVCKTLDISEGGLYVHTSHSFNPGDVIKVSLPFRNEKLEIKSRVKYCHEGVGIGLMFIDLDDTLKTKIKELIEEIKKSS